MKSDGMHFVIYHRNGTGQTDQLDANKKKEATIVAVPATTTGLPPGSHRDPRMLLVSYIIFVF
jgi:hypothetical protein